MKKLLKYVITSAVGLVAALILCVSRGVFTAKTAADVYVGLSDAFFVPAVFMLGVAGLSFASANGAFYPLGYALRTLFSVHNWSKKHKFAERQSYGDYVEAKRENIPKFPFELLWVGLAMLAIATLFLHLFNLVYYA